MQGLFRNEQEGPGERLPPSPAAALSTRLLGFIGSAVILSIGLKFLAPILAGAWGIVWLENSSAQIVVAVLAALPFSAFLARIEGTIWGKYYVIAGYLLALVLIVWIALRLLRYI